MQIENISWDDLRFFLHVARGGSLTAASQSMSVSHATAFRRLQRLEKDIGVHLFSKARTGYKLTDAGNELMAVVADLDLEVQSVMRRLSHRDAWPGGVVRVTTTDTLMHQILPPILTSFQRSTGVQLHVNSSTALLDIVQGEADVAIRAGGRPPDPLVGRRVCRIESTIYHSKKIRNVHLENMHTLPWVGGDDNFTHLDSSKWIRERGLDDSMVIRTSSHVNTLNLLKSGAGLGVLACYMGDLEPSLCRLMPPPKEWRSDLWLLTRAELRSVPRIKKLFDSVYNGTRAMVPLFEGQTPIFSGK